MKGYRKKQGAKSPPTPTMITPLPRRFALSSSYLFHPIELCTCLRVRVRNQRRKRFQVKKMSLQPKSRLLFYFFQNLYVIDMHLRVSDIVFLLNFTRAHTLKNRHWNRSIISFSSFLFLYFTYNFVYKFFLSYGYQAYCCSYPAQKCP